MILQGFCGGSYQSQSPLADNERTINWYAENIEAPGAATRVALYPTPGVETLSTVSPTAGGRGHIYQDGREFIVFGITFAEVDASGTPTFRGLVAVDSNPATLSSNGKAGGQIMITSGGNVYIFTMATNAFAQVATMNGLATMGDQIDGYFLVLDALTSTLYWSDLNAGLTWQTGINFIKRSLASDGWVSMKVASKLIWLLGTQTSETWYDAGTFPRPFAPYSPSVIPYGCAASFSVAVVNGNLLWLSGQSNGSGLVLQSRGSNPTVVSNYAISNVLSGFDTLADALGDSYSSMGHTFFILSFGSADRTLCYDMNTSLWHERGTWISERSQYVAWRPRFFTFAFGQLRALDSQTGAIYRVSETLGLDVDARPIRRLRQSPVFYSQDQRIFINVFELDLEPGLGNTVDPGSNPQVMMRESYDGGKTWGTEHMRSAGRIGEYRTLVKWNRCGAGRRRVFEVSVTDPIPWRILGAFADIRPGSNAGASQQAQA